MENCRSRVDVFNDGAVAMHAKSYTKAIQLFQQCMKMLSEQGEGLTSQLFPLCLENIAECYKELNEMEKALSFKKFEKLYYETVLLNGKLSPEEDSGITFNSKFSINLRSRGDGQNHVSNKEDSDKLNSPDDFQHPQERAEEYEQLANLCLQNNCVSLALEYIGKATILRRHHFGDDHTSTQRSFELFTSIYAEAGKQQYSESIDKVNNLTQSEDCVKTPDNIEETVLRRRRNLQSQGEGLEANTQRPIVRTRSILKKSSATDVTSPPDSPRRQVTFADPLPQMARLREDGDNDDSSKAWLLFIALCMIVVLISVLITALICRAKPGIAMCLQFEKDLASYYRRIASFYRNYW